MYRPTPVIKSPDSVCSIFFIQFRILSIFPLLLYVYMSRELQLVWLYSILCEMLGQSIIKTQRKDNLEIVLCYYCLVRFHLIYQTVNDVRQLSTWPAFYLLCSLDAYSFVYYITEITDFVSFSKKNSGSSLCFLELLSCILFNFQYQYYIVSMSTSAHKNRDTVGDNETLFDFLKRKKKYNLESTVNKTLVQHSQTKKKFDLDGDDIDYHKEEGFKSTNYQSNNEARRGTRETVTPKKIEFDDVKKNKSTLKQQSHTQYQPAPVQGKSFLSMISPLKNRVVAQDENQDKENIPKSTKKINKVPQSFSKKNVTKSINNIKESMNSLSDHIRTFKQKSHGLVLQFHPLSNYLADSNPSMAKQVGDFKNKLKSFQSLIDNANIENSDQIVESFHKNLEQHLQFEEGHIRKTLQKAKQEELSQIRSQKDRLIDRLQNENKKLNKEVDILQRRLQKAQNHHQNLEQAVTERQMTSVEQIQRLKLNYQANIEQLKNKNQQLIERCQQLAEKSKFYEKELKHERYSKEDYEEKRRQQIQSIIQAKDAYLLNQIMVLKAEFNADLNKMNELHKIKEAQLLNRVQKKGEQMNKLAFERGCDKQIQSKILQEANIVKQENSQLKAKVECIITDMYRMNQQLYQHWIALKDIKALSNRLGSFAQYRKIYEELLFNDHLFH